VGGNGAKASRYAVSGDMSIELRPIGFVRTDAREVPRHWSVSEVEGTLVIDEEYLEGLRDIEPGQRIVVIFNFDRSPEFSPTFLRQTPPHGEKEMGVFSICSPIRPNPIGMSVLEVLEVEGATIRVKRLDMLDGTPILDIKPYIEDERDRPGCS
jgi:tRNA (adenine37-N6)-methyltransferase